MTAGKAAPWFDKPGGGEQFIVFKDNGKLYTIEELEEMEVLRDITKLFIKK